jgi:1-acyl-sn-glycerol-3-phosphate acyltransferase
MLNPIDSLAGRRLFVTGTPSLKKWVFFGLKGVGLTGIPHRPINGMIRWGLSLLQKVAYHGLFRTEVRGGKNIPAQGSFIVVSNHASHLDMGLVKHALGSRGSELVALAAKDYFFSYPLRRFYFTNFTNLLPINRRAGLKESLEKAGKVLREGRSLLIFPEGTRSVTGEIAPFKPLIGFLALNYKADVLPAYLQGTFEALPKGGLLPRRLRIGACLGPILSYKELSRRTCHLRNSEAYRAATALVEEAVRRLKVE